MWGNPIREAKNLHNRFRQQLPKGETRRLSALPVSHAGETFVEVCELSGRPSKDRTGEYFEKIRKIGLTQNRISESDGKLSMSY